MVFNATFKIFSGISWLIIKCYASYLYIQLSIYTILQSTLGNKTQVHNHIVVPQILISTYLFLFICGFFLQACPYIIGITVWRMACSYQFLKMVNNFTFWLDWVLWKLGLGLWCLMQLSTIFQVYHGWL
jgi:hypothetical protein